MSDQENCCDDTPPCDFRIAKVVSHKVDTDDWLGQDGILPTLLNQLNSVIIAEYNAGRLNGKEYSDLLLGAMDSAIQGSASFLFNRHRQPYELASMEAQVNATIQQTAMTVAQKNLLNAQAANAEAEGNILVAQLVAAQHEGALAGINVDVRKVELKGLRHDVMTKGVQKLLANAQLDATHLDNDIKRFQLCNILPEEKRNLQANINIALQERNLKAAQVSQTNMQNKALDFDFHHKAPLELDILAAQLDKTYADIDIAKEQMTLFEQKVLVERAQIDGSLIGDGSVLDAAVKLQQAQTAAYDKDQVIKACKLLMDSFSVQYQEGDKTGNTTNLQDDVTLGKFVKQLGCTVGLQLTSESPTP